MFMSLTTNCNRVGSQRRCLKIDKMELCNLVTKKGDLMHCTNWRGISLFSIPGKVMATVLLNRMRLSIDVILRPNQAWFWNGRSSFEQIFMLRQIVDLCVAWQKTVLMNLIDFSKAFDCIHRESLWNIAAMYGIPDKSLTWKLFTSAADVWWVLMEFWVNSSQFTRLSDKVAFCHHLFLA